MILDSKALHWTLKLGGLARANRWTVFSGDLRRQRPEDPSLILLRGFRLVAVYARTSRPRTPPPVDRLPEGVEAYVWTPAQWSEAVAILGSDVVAEVLAPSRRTRPDIDPPPAA